MPAIGRASPESPLHISLTPQKIPLSPLRRPLSQENKPLYTIGAELLAFHGNSSARAIRKVAPVVLSAALQLPLLMKWRSLSPCQQRESRASTISRYFHGLAELLVLHKYLKTSLIYKYHILC